MEEKKTKFMNQAINDEILEKLSLKNRYQFLNTTLMTALEPEQLNFLKKAEKFCMRYENKNNIIHRGDEDIYDWIPDFGREGLISRALSKFAKASSNFPMFIKQSPTEYQPSAYLGAIEVTFLKILQPSSRFPRL